MQAKRFVTFALITACAVPILAHSESKTYHGAACTKDCSGHKAGYEWARKKHIQTPEQCGGKSNSFVEGCRAWAEEHQAPSDVHSADK